MLFTVVASAASDPNATLPQQFTAHSHFWANHSMHILISTELKKVLHFDYPR